MIGSTQPPHQSTQKPKSLSVSLEDSGDDQVDKRVNSLTPAIPQAEETNPKSLLRRRSVTQVDQQPPAPKPRFSIFGTSKKEVPPRPRSNSNAEESPRVNFKVKMKVTFLQQDGMSLEEVDKRKEVLFEKLVNKVQNTKVNLRERVGPVPTFHTHNNYGLTPDKNTPITKGNGVIEFYLDGKLKSVQSPPAWTDESQIYPCEESSIFADAVKVSEHPEHYVGTRSFVIADGCGWGIKAQVAAQTASSIALRIVEERLMILGETTTKEIAKIHIEAFQVAHKELLLLKPPENATYEKIKELTRAGKIAGKTTLTVATIAGRFLIVTRLGDSGVLVLRKNANNLHCFNVIPGSRSDSVDATDCGGSLGNNKKGAADWRNYATSTTELENHDMIVGLTDGALDIFDPEFLGKSPRDFNYPADQWDDKNPKLSDLRHYKQLRGFAKVAGNDLKLIPTLVLNHVSNVVKPTQLFLLENPLKGEPNDYKKFPGKSDHVSLIVTRFEPDLFKK